MNSRSLNLLKVILPFLWAFTVIVANGADTVYEGSTRSGTMRTARFDRELSGNSVEVFSCAITPTGKRAKPAVAYSVTFSDGVPKFGDGSPHPYHMDELQRRQFVYDHIKAFTDSRLSYINSIQSNFVANTEKSLATDTARSAMAAFELLNFESETTRDLLRLKRAYIWLSLVGADLESSRTAQAAQRKLEQMLSEFGAKAPGEDKQKFLDQYVRDKFWSARPGDKAATSKAPQTTYLRGKEQPTNQPASQKSPQNRSNPSSPAREKPEPRRAPQQLDTSRIVPAAEVNLFSTQWAVNVQNNYGFRVKGVLRVAFMGKSSDYPFVAPANGSVRVFPVDASPTVQMVFKVITATPAD